MSELDDFQAQTVRQFLEENWDLFVAHCHIGYANGEQLAEEIFEALSGES